MNLKQSFLQEADELLNDINEHILRLEEDPGDAENVHHIFRAAHTLKGSSNLYGYSGIAILTHLLEAILDDLRSGERLMEPILTDLLLESFDHVRTLTQSIDEEYDDPQGDPELLHRLSQYSGQSGGHAEAVERRQDAVTEDPQEWIAAMQQFMQGGRAAQEFAGYFDSLAAASQDTDKKPDRALLKYMKDWKTAASGLEALHAQGSAQAAHEQLASLLNKLVQQSDHKKPQPGTRRVLLHFLAIVVIIDLYVLRDGFKDKASLWWRDVWGRLVQELDKIMRGGAELSLIDIALDVWELCKPEVQQKQEFGKLLAPHVEEPVLDLHFQELDEEPGHAEKFSLPPPASRSDLPLAKKLVVEQVYFLAPKGRPLIERWDLARRILLTCGTALDDMELQAAASQDAPDITFLNKKAQQYADMEYDAIEHSFTPPPLEAAVNRQREEGKRPRQAGSQQLRLDVNESEKIVRVEQSKIERLMELIGELAVAKNAFPYMMKAMSQIPGAGGFMNDLKEKYAMLDRISKELQDSIVEIRMLPVSSVFSKFNRFVRDLARQSGKMVRVDITGDETTIDKTLVEALSDPLIHLVRNSIDHGIEGAEERRRLNKPSEGLLQLRASREGNRVIIEVSDDGRGIDTASIRKRLLEKEIVSAEHLDALTDDDCMTYIFHPGLSTASEVTSLSGRGVGMDAVKSAINQMQGRVFVSSLQGQGTTVRIEVPLSLSMTAVLQVMAGGRMYGLPLEQIEESVKVSSEQIRSMQGTPVLLLREQVLPVVELSACLGQDAAEAGAADHHYMVILKNGVSLKVDALIGQQEVVIKPLDACFRHLNYLSGASILGDGSVLLIINSYALQAQKQAVML